jgi:hypothetical protein
MQVITLKIFTHNKYDSLDLRQEFPSVGIVSQEPDSFTVSVDNDQSQLLNNLELWLQEGELYYEMETV